MNNPVFLILYISILLLNVKYIADLKSEKFLAGILVLFGIACAGFIINYFVGQFWLLSAGIISGMIIAPLLFSTHLIKRSANKNEESIRLLMLISTFGLLIHYLFKILVMPGAAVMNLVMAVPIIVGIIIILSKNQIKEMKPFQLIMIFLILDFITFLMQ